MADSRTYLSGAPSTALSGGIITACAGSGVFLPPSDPSRPGVVFGSLRGPDTPGDIPEGYKVEHDKRGTAFLVPYACLVESAADLS